MDGGPRGRWSEQEPEGAGSVGEGGAKRVPRPPAVVARAVILNTRALRTVDCLGSNETEAVGGACGMNEA